MESGYVTALLSVLAVLSAALTIAFRVLRPRGVSLFRHLKPLTTLLIFGIALAQGTFLSDPYARYIGIGLLLSLAGDLLLTFPQRFLAGLLCFLLALAAYFAAFLDGIDSDVVIWVGAVLFTVAEGVRRYVWPGLRGPMKAAVSAYMLVMVFTVTLAIGRAELFRTTGAILAAIGALLFLVSDSLLAVDKFRMRLQRVDLEVLVPYYAGQLLIALSVTMQL